MSIETVSISSSTSLLPKRPRRQFWGFWGEVAAGAGEFYGTGGDMRTVLVGGQAQFWLLSAEGLRIEAQ